MACSCSTLNTIRLKTETMYNKALKSELHGETANSLAHLCEMNMHGYIRTNIMYGTHYCRVSECHYSLRGGGAWGQD